MSVYILYDTHEIIIKHWFFVIPITGLVLESFLMICDCKVVQFRYFWPSGFFYITTIVPIIWIIELELLESRLNSRYEMNTSKKLTNRNGTHNHMIEILDHISISKEMFGKKICELGLFIGLIIGRWLIPRGSITREQLSALLLGYVGTTADILEIFELFKEEKVMYEEGVTYAVLSVYTLALYQFTLVTTSSNNENDLEGDRKEMMQLKVKKNEIISFERSLKSDVEKQIYIEDVKRKRYAEKKNNRVRGKGKKNRVVPKMVQKIAEVEEARKRDVIVKLRELHTELFQILVTLLMQDTPFLILRLYVIIVFDIISEMHVFFTCKNLLVLLLLIYRLLILNCNGVDEDVEWILEDSTTKLANIQQAIQDGPRNENKCKQKSVKRKQLRQSDYETNCMQVSSFY